MLALFVLWWAWDGYSAEDVATSCAVAAAGGAQQPELPKMRVIRELQAPAPVASLTWSSDGTKLAAPILIASAELLGLHLPSPFGNLIQVWSSDGHVIRSFKRDRAFFNQRSRVAFVGGDAQIATPMWQSKEAAFFVFDVESGEVVREVAGPYPDDSRTRLVAASPDQSVIAVSFAFGVKPVVLYSARDWTEFGELEVPRNGAEMPLDLAFSHDGRRLAVSRIDGSVLIYDLSSRQVVQRIAAFTRDAPAGKLAWSPDDRMVAVGAGGLGANYPVRVFRTDDGSRVSAYDGAPPSPDRRIAWPIGGVAWRPGDNLVAFISEHSKLHLWDPLQPGPIERIVTMGATGNSSALAFSPDGRSLAVNVDEMVRIFDCTRQ
jgi:WD40 repeat protein